MTVVATAMPQRTRLVIALAVVGGIHVAGLGLLALAGPGAGALMGLAVVAYGRGLVHSLDFDHVAMIDNSLRKFVAEGRRPVSVGLAFSAGHSTVVLLTSAAVIAGVSLVTAALEPGSGLAEVLGLIGLSVSGAYLLLCALANLPRLVDAVRTYRAGGTAALRPAGLLSRISGAPVRWVKHPRHIYLLGFAFSLGFDTSSQIGLLVLVAGATIGGVPPVALLALPVLFTAGMTLVDTLNGVLMLRLYTATARRERRLLLWNIVITSVGVVAALVVASLAAAELLTAAGWQAPGRATAWIDTEWAGVALAGTFLVMGLAVGAGVLRRRARP